MCGTSTALSYLYPILPFKENLFVRVYVYVCANIIQCTCIHDIMYTNLLMKQYTSKGTGVH